MKNINKLIIILIVLLIIAGIMGYFVYQGLKPNSTSNSSTSTTTEVTPVTEVTIEYTEDEQSDEYTNYTAKIDLNNLSSTGSGVNISGSTITIQSAGTYYFSGTATANIVVNAEKQQVILVFDNVNLTSTNTAAINVIKAKEVIINSAKGSTNTSAFSPPPFANGTPAAALADLERRAQQELARMGATGAKKFFRFKK